MTTVSEEKELLRRLAANDQLAAGKIYKDNYQLIQALVVNNNGSIDDARDIFQEAMIVLYEKTRQGSLELNCQLKTYLYAVSRRLWLKKLQQGKRNAGSLESMKEPVDIEDDWQDAEERDRNFQVMENALEGLGEPCKSLIRSYYILKKSMAEIAEDYGYTSADNAKNQKYKCLMRLKKLFFAQYKNSDREQG